MSETSLFSNKFSRELGQKALLSKDVSALEQRRQTKQLYDTLSRMQQQISDLQEEVSRLRSDMSHL